MIGMPNLRILAVTIVVVVIVLLTFKEVFLVIFVFLM